ncbi:type I secretion system permease/ATPase [Lamprobacter modestohalophilus]|uniref:type I secretion system permease/ATPase n=1 Tax=Lamprobacter modestohalophilus TaxID=1064514 RepID=UPI002ADEE431|nr:type I secretion system permease/ATPase [Lamprobacter modestohalophilus]MEA1050405.1 type I secretion system permease/ATPase [Lamprobacter modestohalophilus]
MLRPISRHQQPAQVEDELRDALKGSRGSFMFAGLFSLFINMLMLLPAIYMLQVYDRVLTSSSISTLVALTVLVVALYMVMGLLEIARSWLLVRVSAGLDMRLNERLFTAMFDSGLMTGRGSGAQPISDLTSLRQFLTGQGLFAFFDTPWIPIYLAVIFLLHPLLGWFAVAGLVVIVILAVINEVTTRKPLTESNTLAAANINAVNGHLRNAEALEAMGMLGNVHRRWMSRHVEMLKLQARASDRAGVLANTSKSFRIMLQSLILGLGAYLAVLQEITPGAMIAGSILLGRALSPVDLLIGSWKQFLAARSSYARLRALLQAIPKRMRRMRLPAPKGRLVGEQLVVVPPGGTVPVLRGVSFDIPAGETVGIIGPSAAGKSTLARAALGVWPAASGAVRLDGAAIADWNRDELGPNIGYLPQDVELMEGSVSENISRFGEIDPGSVVTAAQKAGVHEMILRLPKGYDTPIGQGGAVLSGGQRQRVGLARALYGSPCLVVLDEPNSNLDEHGEAALAAALGHLKRSQATVLVITHRPNLLHHVDRIMVLRDGLIQMFGPRDQVMAEFARPAAVGRSTSAVPARA